MAYTNRKFNWDFNKLKRFRDKYVTDSIIKNGPAFDLSAYNAVGGTLATYADLSAALTALNALPAAYKKGGMSFKFVQSSDNIYVQYRCKAQSFSINTEDWAICNNGTLVDNPEFVEVKTDYNGKILWAIKRNGGIYYGTGIPQQVVDYINQKIVELDLTKVNDISTFLGNLIDGDKSLQDLLDEKVNGEEGKSVIDSNYASSVSVVENPEFLEVKTDKNGKILEGIKNDGKHYFAQTPLIGEGNLKKISTLFVNGNLDTNFNLVNEENAISTVIEDANPDSIYLITMPDTMVGAFVGKTESDSNIVKVYNSSGFSLKGCRGKLGIVLKNEYLKAKETPSEISLGQFELGTFNGGGTSVTSDKGCRSGWLTAKGRCTITFSSDVIVMVNLHNSYHNFNMLPKSGTTFTSDTGMIRVAVGYADERTITSEDIATLLSTANISIEITHETYYDLSTSTITGSDAGKIGVYEFSPRNAAFDVVVSRQGLNRKDIDIILNGTHDELILQALFGCYNSININLLSGTYNIDGFHYNRNSDQFSCLSTFSHVNLNNSITVIGGTGEELFDAQPVLLVSSNVAARIDDTKENAIILAPKSIPTGNYEQESMLTTAILFKGFIVQGDLYTKNITVFDTIPCAQSRYDSITVYGTTVGLGRTFPTMPHEGNTGIRCGHGSNYGHQNYLKHCLCIYCGKGFSICGEHFILEDCLAHHCGIGFAFGDKPTKAGFEHPNVMIGCSIESCKRLMLLTKMGDMEEKPFASGYNRIRSTLIVIGLSTEMSWHIPLDELVEGEPDTQPTLPILEILKGAYRGRIETDWYNDTSERSVPFEQGSGALFTFTTYNGTTNIGAYNTVDTVLRRQN